MSSTVALGKNWQKKSPRYIYIYIYIYITGFTTTRVTMTLSILMKQIS